MLGFFLFAVLFVGLLTAVVRLSGIGVRKELPRARELLLTGVFIGLVLLAWWLVTRGERYVLSRRADARRSPLLAQNQYRAMGHASHTFGDGANQQSRDS
jgi:hypothetical protein